MKNIKSNKSWVAMILLVIFAGVFGVHRMYAGKIITGILQLFLTLTGFGVVITSFWAFIDFVMIVVSKFEDCDGKVITQK